MKPALTKEEWKGGSFVRPNETFTDHEHDGTPYIAESWGQYADFDEDCVITTDSYWHGEPRRSLAAACLHNQPFGFTREDVKLLRAFANLCTSDFRNLADRIEALLPPEEE